MANKQLNAGNVNAGFALVLAELLAGAAFPLTAGPFTVAVADPNNTITRTPGSADQTTPDTFFPNGSGNVGTVTVTVTDTSVPGGGLVGVGAFDVVASAPPPPPPSEPDTLTVDFTPIVANASTSSTPASAAATPAVKTAAAAATVGETGAHGEVGELGTNKP